MVDNGETMVNTGEQCWKNVKNCEQWNGETMVKNVKNGETMKNGEAMVKNGERMVNNG